MKHIVAVFFMCLSQFACQCHKDDIDGDYLISYDETSGNCGSLANILIQYKNGKPSQALAENCELNRSGLSDDECEGSSQITCYFADENGDYSIVVTSHEEQQDGGDKVVGTVTVRSAYDSGAQICYSSYDAEGIRQ